MVTVGEWVIVGHNGLGVRFVPYPDNDKNRIVHRWPESLFRDHHVWTGRFAADNEMPDVEERTVVDGPLDLNKGMRPPSPSAEPEKSRTLVDRSIPLICRAEARALNHPCPAHGKDPHDPCWAVKKGDPYPIICTQRLKLVEDSIAPAIYLTLLQAAQSQEKLLNEEWIPAKGS